MNTGPFCQPKPLKILRGRRKLLQLDTQLLNEGPGRKPIEAVYRIGPTSQLVVDREIHRVEHPGLDGTDLSQQSRESYVWPRIRDDAVREQTRPPFLHVRIVFERPFFQHRAKQAILHSAYWDS